MNCFAVSKLAVSFLQRAVWDGEKKKLPPICQVSEASYLLKISEETREMEF